MSEDESLGSRRKGWSEVTDGKGLHRGDKWGSIVDAVKVRGYCVWNSAASCAGHLEDDAMETQVDPEVPRNWSMLILGYQIDCVLGQAEYGDD